MQIRLYKIRNYGMPVALFFISLLIFSCTSTGRKSDLSTAKDTTVSTPASNQSTIKISISVDKPDDGDIKIEVFNSEKEWLKKNAYTSNVKVLGEKCEYTFENIPYGEYAIFVYQDKNSNDIFDMNGMGIPQEPFGFSNDAKAMFGPAKWNDAKLLINSPNVEIPVNVKMFSIGN